jgi:hypothetical protein
MSQFRSPLPDVQITFYQRLQDMRRTLLLDALLHVVARADIQEVDRQLAQFVTNEMLQKVASWGLRGEILFPVPYLLTQHPQLLGYYRRLLGFSQKQFYGKEYGFGVSKSLEEKGRITTRHMTLLAEFCQCLCKSAEFLVQGVEHLSHNSVHELTLLTLGAQLRGGMLNVFGSQATQRVFSIIQAIVAPHIIASTERTIEISNAAGRIVHITFANDPDICIRERLPSQRYRNLVAIEIKGGTDRSNVHNRLGEAEKSHQKARKDGFVECWTMIRVADLDLTLARRESPSTDRFYNIDAITEADSEELTDFRENLCARVGISDQ